MGHNSVVLSYPKSTGIPLIDGLSTGPPVFGTSQYRYENFYTIMGRGWDKVDSSRTRPVAILHPF